MPFRRSTDVSRPVIRLVISTAVLCTAVMGAAGNWVGAAHADQRRGELAQRHRAAIRQGQSAVRALMADSGVPGMSVAVGIGGHLVWSEGFGYADVRRKSPVTPSTLFRLGSVSKLLTAAAVARLHEQGALDLDVPIQTYVPAYPRRDDTITARQLAGHLAGIRHYEHRDHERGRNIDAQHYATLMGALRIFLDDPLVAAPGTRFHYSTFGYTLLSGAVEGASQKHFLQYLQEVVLDPLKMRHTTADRPQRRMPTRTLFYDPDGPRMVRLSPYVDPSYKWGGGGMLSTAEDLVLFGSAHLRPGFFKPETLQMLFRSQRTTDGGETGVGIGWHLGSAADGRPIMFHTGNMGGCRSVLVVYPQELLVVAVLSNLRGIPKDIRDQADRIAGPFLNARER